MIAWLSGDLVLRDPKGAVVVLDVAGVGYELNVSLQCLQEIPEAGNPCQLWVHTHANARDGQTTLYAFYTRNARAMFRLLTTVPKVGPKQAMATLGGFALPELVGCISAGDADKLQKVPGVGKKSAEQIVLTLRERVADDPLLGGIEAMAAGQAGASAEVGSPELSASSRRRDAQAMLVGLGWKSKDVERVLEKVASQCDEDLRLDDLVRRALALLMEG